MSEELLNPTTSETTPTAKLNLHILYNLITLSSHKRGIINNVNKPN